MTQSRSPKNVTDLPAPSRYITDHDSTGLSIFLSSQSEKALFEAINPQMDFFLAYANLSSPSMTDSLDLKYYTEISAGEQPALTIPGGTVLRICNFGPGYTTAMHRTTSLDFGIVLSGEVELLLDSGESRILRVGDVAVQRGTMHAWRTVSKNKWSRMIFILQDALEIKVGGKILTDDYGGIEVQSPQDFSKSAM